MPKLSRWCVRHISAHVDLHFYVGGSCAQPVRLTEPKPCTSVWASVIAQKEVGGSSNQATALEVPAHAVAIDADRALTLSKKSGPAQFAVGRIYISQRPTRPRVL
jgi:hypothetical protein